VLTDDEKMTSLNGRSEQQTRTVGKNQRHKNQE
jgi:hypothetical protein